MTIAGHILADLAVLLIAAVDDDAGGADLEFLVDFLVLDASTGPKATDPPSIILVEDMDAKRLCLTLRKATNGQKTVELLHTYIYARNVQSRLDGLENASNYGPTATTTIRKELTIQIPIIALTIDTSLDVR